MRRRQTGRQSNDQLNVLITRAKKRRHVFSSIVAEDIRSEGGKPGVLALKEFLKLAKDGLAASLALAEDELTVETARLLGFARTGKDVNAAISAAIESHLGGEIERDHRGHLRLNA